MPGIVIIEEDALMRSLIAEWLTMEGYCVCGAEDSCGETSADLVIADVCMPRHAGGERLRDVRSAYPGVPVIAISAQFSRGLPMAGVTAKTFGVSALIAKPFDCATLLRAVRSIIGLPAEKTADAEPQHAEPAGR